MTYGQDEEKLERTLREKYGNEIRQVEHKRTAMGDMYTASIKDIANHPEQQQRLDQVLKGGRGTLKRHHAIDPQYYGTQIGKEQQLLAVDRMAEHQEEERKRAKRVKKNLKKLRKQQKQQQEEGGTSSDSSDGESDISSEKKAAAALGAVALVSAAVADASRTTNDTNSTKNPFQKVNQKVKEKALKKKQKKQKEATTSSRSIDLTQVATLTAVAGAAALVGFLVGGGSSSRR